MGRDQRMYSTTLTTSEIVKRIVGERDRLISQAESLKGNDDDYLARDYLKRAEDIGRLMNLLEIREKWSDREGGARSACPPFFFCSYTGWMESRHRIVWPDWSSGVRTRRFERDLTWMYQNKRSSELGREKRSITKEIRVSFDTDSDLVRFGTDQPRSDLGF